MALKAVLETLEGLSDEVKEHYTEKDGQFYLDVTKVDGFALENVGGLKSTVEKLRATEKTLQQTIRTNEDALKEARTKYEEFTTKYDGIDAEQARSALEKIDEIQNWDGETKVREAVQVAEQKIEQKMQSKMNELVNQHSTKVEKLENALADSQEQLQDAIVTRKIVEAVNKAGGNVDILMPHVRSQVQMTQDNHGKWRPEVIKTDGTPRVGDSSGNDMTIEQLVQEMKSTETFAACFPGANSTGSGKSGSSDTGSSKKTGEVKVVAASDKTAMSKGLEDIASGKVQVDMTK